MRRLPLALAALALAGIPPEGAAAFNPQPRPAPAGVTTVCADDATVRCCADDNACNDVAEVPQTSCASGTCVGDPADLASAVAVRGTVTLISDEDVTGWNGPGSGYTRDPAAARLTLLLQYERNGALHTFAETYQLGTDGCFLENPDDPALCIPGDLWNQPASEATVTDPALNVVYTVLGGAVGKAVAVELTGDPNTTARPYLDVVDRLSAATSNHSGTDPVASVQQVKVTIRLAP
jgi:hypothetical protein